MANDLVSQLRANINDDRATSDAFTLSLENPANVRSAIVEIANGFLTVTVEGGENAKSLRFNLSEPRHAKIGKLVSELHRIRGYVVVPDKTMSLERDSVELKLEGLPNLVGGPASFRHYIFSDEELTSFLLQGAGLHNPNYTTIGAIPKVEHIYVLLKAQALAYRKLAADSSRRKGMDNDAHTFVTLANDLERQYNRDVDRLHRVIPAPKADESKMGTGDVVQGTLLRRSLRAGYTSPIREALPPVPPNLYDFAEDDAEDLTVRLRFSQSRGQSHVYYEIWRDTQPVVERNLSGRMPIGTYPIPTSTQYSRAGSSRQVLGGYSIGQAPIFDGFFSWSQGSAQGTSLVNATFIDGLIYNSSTGVDALGEPLEPDTDYYYRVYAVNWNGEIVQSQVRKARTRSIRGRLKRIGTGVNSTLAPDAITPTQGTYLGGDAITLLGNNFIEGTTVQLNGKQCSDVVIVDSNTITCTSPAFANTDWIGRKADVIVTSPNGLRDITSGTWTFTP